VKAVKIKPMLTRLQNTIGRDDLIEQMILVAPTIPMGAQSSWDTHPTNDKTDKLMHSAKFIVGYNSSCNSHTALDIALCMAHQARLASNMQITVQAVFVVEDQNWYTQDTNIPTINQSLHEYLVCDLPNTSKSLTPVLTEARFERNLTTLEQADTILCQARSLAEEWQSHFQAYLRFGSVATELKEIIKSEGADVLFLGCNSPDHPIIESLGSDLRCVILGIPSAID
jgi:hypothetical protein